MTRRLMRDDSRGEGKVPVIRERLTIEKIVGDISLSILIRAVVGIGSN